MTDMYNQNDDYQIAVTYLSSALSEDYELLKATVKSVEAESLQNGFMLLSTLLFLELEKTYPDLTPEEFAEKVRRRDFSR